MMYKMLVSYNEQKEIPADNNKQKAILVDNYENSLAKNESYNTPEEVLKVLFGYDSFRKGQKSVIDSILSGKDAIAVMPTSAGKSVCYQIPAILLPGITLVISPLISLMQDQVKTLNEVGISSAFINSSLSETAFYKTVEKARQGLYKIIYVAPERLVTEIFLDLARNVQISMVAVDEAHCISQWGQDFRPSYKKIVEFVKLLPNRPIISAFTATATKNVREDIICTLELNNPYILVTGFNRENLFFQVEKPKNKDQYILNYLSKHPKDSGIIYCSTRKNVDNLYELLKSKGKSVAKYHAGMGAADRKKMQDDFVFDYISIVVATNAFGMGIDKSNVRFVIHYNMPQSMENYYQEAGRAGRDGLEAKCILLFSPQDIVINRFLLEHKEMNDLDSIDIKTVKERDNKRLQIMERYCYTTQCLRNNILKYFGESPQKPCGNCGNCLREFEELDMTDAAKKIINCVYEAKGRYGKNIIIDTVVGAKTARLEEIASTKYKTYGVLPSANKKLLKRLIEQLVMEGYLLVGDYQVIKLGDISKLKNPETHIFVKITDEDKLPEKASILKSKKEFIGMESLDSIDLKLFERLRELRLKIAREENMPPYIIFSDKTLMEMALKVPVSENEMMAVSGVAQNKFNKYGEKFLNIINESIVEYPKLIQNKTVNSIENETCFERENKITKKKKEKQEFFLTAEEAKEFKYVDYYYISEIRDEMNRICKRDNVKKLAAIRITELLIEEGLISEQENNGSLAKVITERGIAKDIKEVQKVSEKGNAYTILKYPKSVQKIIVQYYIGEERAKKESELLTQKREKYASSYSPWTDEEDKTLTKEFVSGNFSISELSKIHGRTSGAISARLVKLKLIE